MRLTLSLRISLTGLITRDRIPKFYKETVDFHRDPAVDIPTGEHSNKNVNVI